ncbi:hypothetical protein CF386_11245 [Paraphotobacterium marinum]|uniref:DUF2513 domain-containing protein n=1 Tax=Paraphotobacterium marinum TaxID=1755811 RepID=A0A220VHG5_9GAMM|nr:hypothetical protein [Paraphotobacterium marinum]ASK79622.1 hypothetical protein CF386_11245 [Paraphotobacterium marinum]
MIISMEEKKLLECMYDLQQKHQLGKDVFEYQDLQNSSGLEEQEFELDLHKLIENGFVYILNNGKSVLSAYVILTKKGETWCQENLT